jgi:hypothetical protein
MYEFISILYLLLQEHKISEQEYDNLCESLYECSYFD